MNTTTVEHQQDGTRSRKCQWRIRSLACVGVALVATSAGLGALVQRESAFLGKKPAGTVVHENGGFGIGGIELARPPLQCTSTDSGPRLVTVAFGCPTARCSTILPVLDSDRVSVRSSL
jgi:hypothetical protein